MPFIYVVHEREFRRLNEPVWKVGFTDQEVVEARIKQYPKKSRAILTGSVSDGRAAEGEMLRILDNMPGVKARRDIGREYYECPHHLVAGAFATAILGWGNAPCLEDEAENDVDDDDACSVASTVVLDIGAEVVDDAEAEGEDPRAWDAFAAVTNFVEDIDDELHGSTVVASELYERYRAWSQDKLLSKQARKVKLGGFVERLRKVYAAKVTTAQRDGKCVCAVKMPALRANMPEEDREEDAWWDVCQPRRNVTPPPPQQQLNPTDIEKWLADHVLQTGEPHDGFALKELYGYIGDMVPSKKAFYTVAVAWLRAHLFQYRETGSMWVDDKWKTTDHMVRQTRIVRPVNRPIAGAEPAFPPVATCAVDAS